MKVTGFLIFVLTAATFLGCSRQQSPKMPENDQVMNKTTDSMAGVRKAVAIIEPTKNGKVTGTVTFTKEQGGIKVVAHLRGLKSGKHGFHIHQWGDCSASDGTSAGGHFNPDQKNHGAPSDSVRHVGDLGNIVADDNGVGYYERVDSVISFTGAHSIIGRGIIIHQGEDDLQSQPTGNAGARVGCGVIGITAPGD